MEVCEMQNAEIVLAALRRLGKNRTPLERVYRQLYNEDLYLAAYDKLYSNKGALTKGTQDETIDGMNLSRIRTIIEEIRTERFRFAPARRAWINKKNGQKRPLGIPNFKDKLVQEVIRGLLDAYYEPRFSDNSHGFRPIRGCHTSLAQIRRQFKGIAWYIEGDIQGCFDNIDHSILMSILSRDIQDNRLLNLIRQGLSAGVIDEWKHHRTYSGTPQGAILSPLLANIYLNELDQFVEKELLPKWNRGEKRKRNPLIRNYEYRVRKARERQDFDELQRLIKERRQHPYMDVQDPDYRRLKYVRYADDFILGFSGTHAEALEIKDAIAQFLKHHLNLTLSDEKTLITQARKEKASFLGYELSTHQENTKLYNDAPSDKIRYKRRSINGSTRLGVPFGLAREKGKRFMANGKPVHRIELLNRSVAEIIAQYQTEFRGLVEYYKYAEDLHELGSLKYVMEQSLVKTLAHKLKTTVSAVYRRYQTTVMADGQPYKVIQETIETDKGPKTFSWGGIPLKRWQGEITRPINDEIHTFKWSDRSDLVTRLQKGRCEICGSDESVQVHHIRKLRDLKGRWQGRKEKPEWVKRMIALQRKTLVVCEQCHQDIHHRPERVTLPRTA
jgi:group II intron reverse transcriptase/maturase